MSDNRKDDCICGSPGSCAYAPQSPCRPCNESQNNCKMRVETEQWHLENQSFPGRLGPYHGQNACRVCDLARRLG